MALTPGVQYAMSYCPLMLPNFLQREGEMEKIR